MSAVPRRPVAGNRDVRNDRNESTWSSWDGQKPQGLTGCLDDIMYSASGRATPGLLSQLAINAARDIAFQREQTLGRIQQIQNFGAHVIHRREATPGRFTLTTFLCTLQRATSKTLPALRLHASYRHAATLDTGPLAKSYPRGIRPRLSSNHFQSARSRNCYPALGIQLPGRIEESWVVEYFPNSIRRVDIVNHDSDQASAFLLVFVCGFREPDSVFNEIIQ